MAKQTDIVDRLLVRLPLPEVVGEIKAAIASTDRLLVELQLLLQLAVGRHGDAPASRSETPNAEPSPEAPKSGLTVLELLDAYKASEKYKALRFSTRSNYESMMSRVERALGPESVQSLDADRLQQVYDEWSEGGKKITIGRGLIGMLRILASFGSTVLKDHDCRSLRVTLHDMRFETSKPRGEMLTQAYVEKIRNAAHTMGVPSIALAQAIQFDCRLRQKEVIGEYVPLDEPAPPTDITSKFGKWVRGLRWNHIDENFVLRHVTSVAVKEVVIDLRQCPMVMEELQRRFGKLGEPLTRNMLPATGAVIEYEETKRPYLTHQFRRVWRLAAGKAGVPNNVRNMDSRPRREASGAAAAQQARGRS